MVTLDPIQKTHPLADGNSPAKDAIKKMAAANTSMRRP
jgi:hypothetical protein